MSYKKDTMPDLPEVLRLNVMLPADTSPQRIFELAIRLFAKNSDVGVTQWRTAKRVTEMLDFDKATIRAAPVDADFDRLSAASFEDGFSFQGRSLVLIVKPIENGALGKPSETYGIDTGWWFYVACNYLDETSAEDFRVMLALLTGMLPELAQALPPLRAEIRRNSETYLGPMPPLARPEVVMACLNTDLVPIDYADPDGFWSAWDRVDDLGHGLALVQRGVDVVDETAFKAIALRSGMAMARAAKPGRTKYYLPEPSPAEQALLDAEESYLEQVGYKAEGRSLEFTAMVPDGAHLPARDLYLLMQYLESGTSAGPVELVVVTFPTREMAAAEARPLHDIGARVQYLAPSGDWLTLED